MMAKRRRTAALGITGGLLAIIGAALGVALKDLALIPDWGVTAIVVGALACLIAFFVLHFETVKTFSNARSTRLGFNSVLMVLLFLAILEFINVLAYRHPFRIDLSEHGQFTVAPQTRNVLGGLSEPVTVTAFSREGSKGASRYRDLLETYRYHSDHVTYTIADPDKKPALARQYGITTFDTAIIESGGRTSEVSAANEQALTNGIIRVSRDAKTSVRFLTGHGEPGLDDTGQRGYATLKAAIQNQGYDVSTVSRLQDPAPDDRVSVLVIAGPRRMLTDDELAHVRRHLLRKGRLLLLLDPVIQPETRTGIEPLLALRGVRMGRGIIMDPESRLSGAEFTIPIVTSYPDHEMTRGFDLATFFPLARSVHIDESGDPRTRDAWDIRPIAATNPTSWEAHGRARPSPAGAPEGPARAQGNADRPSGGPEFNASTDIKGPLTVAMAVGPKKTRGHGGVEVEVDRPPAMVVIGDSDFVTNAYVNFSGNRDFLLNTLHWLAEEDDLIAIAPKTASFEPMVLTSNQATILLYAQVIVFPAVVFGIGAYVWQKRRRL